MYRAIARRGRDAFFARVENFWAQSFRVAHTSSPVARWASPGSQRVLVIAPHPDDEVAGCAGTLLRHKSCGDWVAVAFVSDGRKSRALGLTPEQMAIRRRAEAHHSAKLLNLDHVAWFGLHEGEWAEETLAARLDALLQQTMPDVIYAPSRVDFHAEHWRTARVTAHVLADVRANCQVRIYPIQVPLTSVLTNLVCDVSPLVVQCRVLVRGYATQTASLERTQRMRHYTAAWARCGNLAEEFWQLDAPQYIVLHETELSPSDSYRGLRQFPFTDPLAYWQARAERERLRQRVKVVL